MPAPAPHAAVPGSAVARLFMPMGKRRIEKASIGSHPPKLRGSSAPRVEPVVVSSRADKLAEVMRESGA